MSIKDLNVIVVGGGIIGSLVARQLDDMVDSLVVIDKVELPHDDFYCIDYVQLELSQKRWMSSANYSEASPSHD